MIAFLADRSHRLAINPWVRAWLRINPIFRLIIVWLIVLVLVPVVIMMLMSVFLVVSLPSAGVAGALDETTTLEGLTDALGGFINNVLKLCFVGSCCAPQFLFGVPVLIFLLELAYTRSRITDLMKRYGGILATKAEYLGAYPAQPHSRFVYLVLAGTRQNPEVIMVVGKHAFRIPVIEVVGEKPKATPSAGELSNYPFLHWMSSAFGARANFVIRYAGEAGRVYEVEFGSFYDGPVGAQKWVNFIVSTRYEAETGETPYQPWRSLSDKGKKRT